jgi:hypothetical protein
MQWLVRPVALLSPRRPNQSTSDLQRRKWHREMFFSEYVCFLLSVSFRHCSIIMFCCHKLKRAKSWILGVAPFRLSKEHRTAISVGLQQLPEQSHVATSVCLHKRNLPKQKTIDMWYNVSRWTLYRTSFCSMKATSTTFREIAIFTSDCHNTHLFI